MQAPRRRGSLAGVLLAALILCCAFLGQGTATPQTHAPSTGGPPTGARRSVPVLAYYYIWFNELSWERAKSDYPLLGRYSSDDERVMRQHIRWAKAAGIGGFIVSWKGTEVLDRRLATLVRIAATEHFKLAIVYEGLDFHRSPLPTAQVAADLTWFAGRYAHDEVFDLFGKPAVIWSGTWRYSTAEVAAVSGRVRRNLLVLASEHNVPGYRRLSKLVDGNAYYWSSVNPETNGTYYQKLQQMSSSIHADGGLWLAPAAPGFDARMIGGRTVVERKDGATLRRELGAALGSSPDAVGLISWNEFSENSYVEPSQRYGTAYLKQLQLALGVQDAPLPPQVADGFDSSDPVGASSAWPLVAAIGAGALLITVGSLLVIARRTQRSSP